MKAIGVATREDLAGAKAYERVADMLLIDAKPPKDAVLPGGNGRPFDWRLTQDFYPTVPWLLSGGLEPEQCRGRDRAEQRAWRRRLLGRRECAGGQGSGQDQIFCRGGPARFRARRRWS